MLSSLKMKRCASFSILGLCLLIMVYSCEHPRQINHFAGFQDCAQDTVFIDMSDSLCPASSLSLDELVKCDGYYFLSFREEFLIQLNRDRRFILALSEKNQSLRSVPVPPAGYLTVRDGRLVAKYDGRVLFVFNAKSWSWEDGTAENESHNVLYEDDDWLIRYSDHGEFGYMSWFIDKHSSLEYAFASLYGQVHRIDSTYYAVSKTRIYKIPNPDVGFPCDSTTRYESAKDVRLINVLFFRNGYYTRHKPTLPLIEFDHAFTPRESDALTPLYELSPLFDTDYHSKPDTVILGSFKCADTLYCLLNTPMNTVLTKLDEDHLSTVHEFPKRYDVQDRQTWRNPEKPDEEILVVLASDRTGASSLVEIGKDGDRIISLQYPHGLVPQESDGFEPLLEWLISHWGSFTFDDAVLEEETLGGKISYLNLDRDDFPRTEELRSPEAKYTNVITKQLGDSLYIYSNYLVRERDSIVTAVCLVWKNTFFNPYFHRTVYDNLSESFSKRFGPADASYHSYYSEYRVWKSDPFSIRLEYSDYKVTATFF